MIALQLEFHTRDSALRTLCRKYWAVTEEGKFAHGIRELAREFGVPAGKLSRKVGQNCTAFSNELACSDCLRTHDPRSRSEYEERLRAREWTCLDCVEKARLAREEARRIEEERKRQVLADHYRSHTLEALSLERLTFTSAVYLLSFVRAGASEDLSYLCPLDEIEVPLAPTRDLEEEVVRHLFEKSVIGIHPGSALENFTFEEGESFRFDRRKVHWALAGMEGGKPPASILSDLEQLFRTGKWPETWYADVEAMVTRVTYHEALEY